MQKKKSQVQKFRKAINNIICTIEILDDSSLKISYLDSKTKDEYMVMLSESMIKEDKQLWRYFQTPQEIFDELTTNFNNINFLPQGVLTFTLSIGQKKTAELSIKLNKTESNALMIVIHKLQQKHQKLEQRFLQTENQLTTYINYVLQQEDKIQKLNNQLSKAMKLIQKHQSQFKEQYISSTIKEIMSNQYYMKNVAGIIIGKTKKIRNLEGHSEHKYNNEEYFEVEQNENILTKIRHKKGWVNYIVEKSLCSHKIYQMVVEVLETDNSMMSLGVGSALLLGKINTLRYKTFITYSFSRGSASCEGVHHSEILGGKIRKGEKIRMIINRRDETIIWQKQDIEGKYWYQLYCLNIPEYMEDIELFPIITILEKGDSVKLIVDDVIVDK